VNEADRTAIPTLMSFRSVRTFLACVAILLQGLAPLRVQSQVALTRDGQRPNLILIVADDLAPGDLGCYGQTEVRTPHIDRLASEGVRFTQAYAGSPHDSASRAAILTGHHAGTGTVRGEAQGPLLPEDITLAEVLRAVGYRAVGLGKWGLGWEGTTGHPRSQGFEEWMGFLESRDALHPFPERLWRNEEEYTPWSNRGGESRLHAQDLFLLAATNVMRFNPDRPFFTYYAATLPLARNPITTIGAGAQSPGRYSDRKWSVDDKRKAEAISRLDDGVGQILSALAKHKLTDNTIVILTSDQPPQAADAFHLKSGPDSGTNAPARTTLREAALRVPLILWWRGVFAAGKVSDEPVAHWDLLPTIAEMARAPIPKDLDGTSFFPLFRGRERSRSPRPFYWESNTPEPTNNARAARIGPWKAVQAQAGARLSLHALPADALQTNDVASAHPAELLKFREELDARVRAWIPPTNPPPRPPWDSKASNRP
jgi:hypothetical protein